MRYEVRADDKEDENMTAPKVCENCGAALDAGETCDCRADVEKEDEPC